MNNRTKNSPKKDSNLPQQPPTEFIERFLELQNKELELRGHELGLEIEREKNNRSVAEISIKANLEDRKNHRNHLERKSKHGLRAVSIFLLIIAGVICYCLHLGKEALLIKSVEVIGLLVAGFMGGYGYKTSRTEDKNSEDNVNSVSQ